MMNPDHVCMADHGFYQLSVILTALMRVDQINVAYLMACIMMLHFLNDVINDDESTQK